MQWPIIGFLFYFPREVNDGNWFFNQFPHFYLHFFTFLISIVIWNVIQCAHVEVVVLVMPCCAQYRMYVCAEGTCDMTSACLLMYLRVRARVRVCLVFFWGARMCTRLRFIVASFSNIARTMPTRASSSSSSQFSLPHCFRQKISCGFRWMRVWLMFLKVEREGEKIR